MRQADGHARGVADESPAAVELLGPLLLGLAEPCQATGLGRARDGQDQDQGGQAASVAASIGVPRRRRQDPCAMDSPGPRARGGPMPRINTRCCRHARPGLAEAVEEMRAGQQPLGLKPRGLSRDADWSATMGRWTAAPPVSFEPARPIGFPGGRGSKHRHGVAEASGNWGSRFWSVFEAWPQDTGNRFACTEG